MASFPQASPPTPCALVPLYHPPYVPHALPISFVSILPPARCTLPRHWKWIVTKFGPKVFQSSTRRSDPCVPWGPKVCYSSNRRSDSCVPWRPQGVSELNSAFRSCSVWPQGVSQLKSAFRSVCSVEPQGVPQLISALRLVCSVGSQGVPQLISALRSVCSVEPQGAPRCASALLRMSIRVSNPTPLVLVMYWLWHVLRDALRRGGEEGTKSVLQLQ